MITSFLYYFFYLTDYATSYLYYIYLYFSVCVEIYLLYLNLTHYYHSRRSQYHFFNYSAIDYHYPHSNYQHPPYLNILHQLMTNYSLYHYLGISHSQMKHSVRIHIQCKSFSTKPTEMPNNQLNLSISLIHRSVLLQLSNLYSYN